MKSNKNNKNDQGKEEYTRGITKQERDRGTDKDKNANHIKQRELSIHMHPQEENLTEKEQQIEKTQRADCVRRSPPDSCN